MINIQDKYKDRYFINGVNVFDAFGVIIEKGGYAELLKETKRKEGYVYTWKDQNGTQRFVEPYFESSNITLSFVFICETLQEYLTKSKALYDVLKSKDLEEDETGYIKISSTTLEREWNLLYTDTTNVTELTDLYRGGFVIVRHTMTFVNDDVTSGVFEPIAFLVDENGNYLTDENGNFLTQQI